MIEDEIKDIKFHIVSKKLVHKHNIPLWGDIKVFCLVIKPNI